MHWTKIILGGLISSHWKESIGSRLVFFVKQNQEGKVERCKVRLVAHSYTQTQRVDYQETSAPVTKMDSIRTLLSCAARLGWDFHQLDVKNAFLHGELDEEVYMKFPTGFVRRGAEGLVCCLRKSLYGLKQSPRAWFVRILKAILKF